VKKEVSFYRGQEHQQAFDAIKSYLIKPMIILPPIRNKNMKLYISASDSIIGSMLAQEDKWR
jgi:hypothetical protein